MCTRFHFKDANGKNYVARTMDFASEVGTEYGEWLPGDHTLYKTEYAFKAKFSSKMKMRFVSDGFNEKGLSLETLWLPETTLAVKLIPDTDNGEISAAVLSQCILGKCATIADVKAYLEGKTVVIPDASLLPLCTVHISLTGKASATDATVENWVVEMVDGKAVWFKNELGVMTNAPSFPWHVTNLRNFTQIDTYNKESKKFMGKEFQHTSFGANQLGLPGGVDSASRFVRTAVSLSMALELKKPADEEDAVRLADHVAGLVTVVAGVSGDSGQKFDQTLWTVCKALDNYKDGFWQKGLNDLGWKKLVCPVVSSNEG